MAVYAVPRPSASTVTVAPSNSTSRNWRRADFVCDGTDDHVQLQAAIDRVAAGGVVQILDGTLNITPGNVRIENPWITVRGVGGGTVLHLLEDPGAQSGINVLAQGCTIADMRCTVDASHYGGVLEFGADDCGAERIHMTSPAIGVQIQSGDRVRVIDCTVTTIKQFPILDFGVGIYATPGRDLIVRGVHTHCGAGINAVGVGVIGAAVRGAVVTGCTFDGTRLTIEDAKDGICSNLVIRNVRTGSGVHLISTASRNLLTGIVVRDTTSNPSYCVHIDGGDCDNNHLVGCSLSGGFTADYLDTGTDNRTTDVNRLTGL